jgi:hypothetical protein
VFFSDREKEIYESPLGGRYDPLRVDRLLTVHSGNRLDEWIRVRNAATGPPTGDISKEGKTATKVAAAEAELELAQAARLAFALPDFPECGDATALEVLYDYLGWMEGKDSAAGTPQSSPQMVEGLNYEPTTSG